MPRFLRQLKDIGFCGVQNFPTVGLIDGTFRQNLEETGMSYSLEVDMIREAHNLGLLTTPYVFTVEDAEAMTRAGADERIYAARRAQPVRERATDLAATGDRASSLASASAFDDLV